jgi:hypothetical protein
MIEVRYLCRCMVEEAVLQVRPRRKGEDLIEWINEGLGPVLFADHKRRSPQCPSTKTEYCKFEVPENTQGVRFPPRLDS